MSFGNLKFFISLEKISKDSWYENPNDFKLYKYLKTEAKNPKLNRVDLAFDD